jgi:hypothetical protein
VAAVGIASAMLVTFSSALGEQVIFNNVCQKNESQWLVGSGG